MALDLDNAIKIAALSDEEPLILRLVAEVQMLQREKELDARTILRLSTELAYSEARAERLVAHNAEMVAAVVSAQTDGIFEMPPIETGETVSGSNT